LQKLEADKTTYYDVSQNGNATEIHLTWRGNDRGETLQQVAEGLDIELPIAFDTNLQKFDGQL
jgi:hypothetical protein